MSQLRSNNRFITTNIIHNIESTKFSLLNLKSLVLLNYSHKHSLFVLQVKVHVWHTGRGKNTSSRVSTHTRSVFTYGSWFTSREAWQRWHMSRFGPSKRKSCFMQREFWFSCSSLCALELEIGVGRVLDGPGSIGFRFPGISSSLRLAKRFL